MSISRKRKNLARTLRNGAAAEVTTRAIGFRRSCLVMNGGSWIEPRDFPKSRSDVPAEINGRCLFATKFCEGI